MGGKSLGFCKASTGYKLDCRLSLWMNLLFVICCGVEEPSSAQPIAAARSPYLLRNRICQKITAIQKSGRRYSLIVVAEGAAPIGGEPEYYIKGGGLFAGRLGGIGFVVGNMLADCVAVNPHRVIAGWRHGSVLRLSIWQHRSGGAIWWRCKGTTLCMWRWKRQFK